MSDTAIEWTDKTWNPVRGCSLVSEGCRRCYAMKFAHRFSGPGQPYEGLTELGPDGPRWTGKVRTVHGMLDVPLRWRKPSRIFVNSMSDMFHEDVPVEFIDQVFAVMALCPQHSFQILTKRPHRMLQYLRGWACQLTNSPCAAGLIEECDWPLPNVWLGVSVEDQKTADERIPLLLQTPAAVRFVSYEPALGPVDFPLGIDWVICGGESGPNARPMHPDWARSARDQCIAAGVPFFFKQWGEYLHRDAMTDDQFWTIDRAENLANTSQESFRIGKKFAGRMLDGRKWNEFPVRL